MDIESNKLIESTVNDLHMAFETRDLTATALVEWYLRRIEAYNDKLCAILTVNPDARNRASELDTAFEETGLVGPLHGMPIILKDNHSTHDLPTTAGSTVFADSIPSRDAFTVKQYRNAGGIILAKANLQEFSFGADTVSSLGGETRNPYSIDHRPSGSSGGTAAAVAANMGTLGTGTDTCSSVRSPPAFTSLVGIRPTMGLVSRTGIIPLSSTQDTPGPITRTVEDAALMLDVMVGYDSDDPITVEGVGRTPNDSYCSHLDKQGLADARIGVVRDFFGLQDESLGREAEAELVTSIIDTAIGDMKSAGATIIDPFKIVDTKYLSEARVVGLEFNRDLCEYLEKWTDDDQHQTLAAIVDSGEIHPFVRERIESLGILEVNGETLSENIDYFKRLARRQSIAVETQARMVNQNVDALLYPPSTIPPVAIPDQQPFSELCCELAAHTGLPAITVPAGFTDDGLPVGVELLGKSFAEPRLIELAYSYEQTTNHREPPVDFSSI